MKTHKEKTMSAIGKISQKIIDRFLNRSNVPDRVPIELYENGSEEIIDEFNGFSIVPEATAVKNRTRLFLEIVILSV